jgi:hypothetical protein
MQLVARQSKAAGSGERASSHDLDQCVDFRGVDNLTMVPWLVDNVPTPTNSIAVLVVLCVFLFGGMAFAKFVERRAPK